MWDDCLSPPPLLLKGLLGVNKAGSCEKLFFPPLFVQGGGLEWTGIPNLAALSLLLLY